MRGHAEVKDLWRLNNDFLKNRDYPFPAKNNVVHCHEINLRLPNKVILPLFTEPLHPDSWNNSSWVHRTIPSRFARQPPSNLCNNCAQIPCNSCFRMNGTTASELRTTAPERMKQLPQMHKTTTPSLMKQLLPNPCYNCPKKPSPAPPSLAFRPLLPRQKIYF